MSIWAHGIVLSPPVVGAFGDGAFDTAVPLGGYKIRPYRPAPGLLVGADAHIGPPAAGATYFADRTHPKPPLGAQGEVARSAGGDQNRPKPGQTIPQSRFASQLPLHKGACPLRHKGGKRSAMVHPRRQFARADIKSAPTAPLCYTSPMSKQKIV